MIISVFSAYPRICKKAMPIPTIPGTWKQTFLIDDKTKHFTIFSRSMKNWHGFKTRQFENFAVDFPHISICFVLGCLCRKTDDWFGLTARRQEHLVLPRGWPHILDGGGQKTRSYSLSAPGEIYHLALQMAHDWTPNKDIHWRFSRQ